MSLLGLHQVQIGVGNAPFFRSQVALLLISVYFSVGL